MSKTQMFSIKVTLPYPSQHFLLYDMFGCWILYSLLQTPYFQPFQSSRQNGISLLGSSVEIECEIMCNHLHAITYLICWNKKIDILWWLMTAHDSWNMMYWRSRCHHMFYNNIFENIFLILSAVFFLYCWEHLFFAFSSNSLYITLRTNYCSFNADRNSSN